MKKSYLLLQVNGIDSDIKWPLSYLKKTA